MNDYEQRGQALREALATSGLGAQEQKHLASLLSALEGEVALALRAAEISIKERHVREKLELSQSLIDAINDRDKLVYAAQQEVRGLQRELDELAQRRVDLKIAKREADAELNTARYAKSLLEERVKLGEEKAASLQHTLTSLEAAAEASRREVDEMRTALDEAQAANGSVRETLETTEAALRELQQVFKQKDRELVAANDELARVVAQQESASGARLEVVEPHLRDIVRRNEALKQISAKTSPRGKYAAYQALLQAINRAAPDIE